MDVQFVDHKTKRILMVEMSCTQVDNCAKKDTGKIENYRPLRFELRRQHRYLQMNVIIDVLG